MKVEYAKIKLRKYLSSDKDKIRWYIRKEIIY